MKHIDLFSGIGGFALACEWAGIETICFCEIDKFCRKVLKKHWPNVPCIEDVNNVEEITRIITDASDIERRPGQFSGAETPIRATGDDQLAGNDSHLLTAGFPCQPFSNAGRKRGANDDRYLWPQTFRIIEAVKPDWVILENVPGILNMVFPDSAAPVASQATLFSIQNDEICDYNTISGGIERDLRQAGYETVWLVIPACSLGAPHRRDRVWIVANRAARDDQFAGEDSHATDTRITCDPKCEGLERQRNANCATIQAESQRTDFRATTWGENWYEVATRFCRVDARIPDRVDRLKSLGNAIVPQVAYQIVKNIVEIGKTD